MLCVQFQCVVDCCERVVAVRVVFYGHCCYVPVLVECGERCLLVWAIVYCGVEVGFVFEDVQCVGEVLFGGECCERVCFGGMVGM